MSRYHKVEGPNALWRIEEMNFKKGEHLARHYGTAVIPSPVYL